MRDIILKQTSNDALEAVLPVDRAITIDINSLVSLYDTCIKIEEGMIEKEL